MIYETRRGQNRSKTQVGAGRISLWRHDENGFSPIQITAALSVVALLAALGWQATKTLQAKNDGAYTRAGSATERANNPETMNIAEAETMASGAATSSGPNDFSQVGTDAFGQLIGSYVGLKQTGAYTPAEGEAIANNAADSMQAPVAYEKFTRNDIKADLDSSYKRMLVYRDDMRTALAPLLLNKESELGIFAHYTDSHDKSNLTKLGVVAGRYREAADGLMKITVPKDAVTYHLAIANALLAFAATLDAMVKNADDAMATLALLRAYNTAEQDVLLNFNALASYERHKKP